MMVVRVRRRRGVGVISVLYCEVCPCSNLRVICASRYPFSCSSIIKAFLRKTVLLKIKMVLVVSRVFFLFAIPL